MKHIKVISNSYAGIKKKGNEDGLVILKEPNYILLGVFDGVGSAQGARAGVDLVIKFIESKARSFYKNGLFDLAGLVKKINSAVISSAIYQPFSTCTITWISRSCTEDTKFLSLGDSRIYSVGKQHLSQLTTDHNVSPDSNTITKYLGKEDLSEESFIESEYSGDENSLLICTDGLYKQIENLGEFHRILNLKYIKCVKNGIDRTIKGINVDDATYIIVRWKNVRN